MQSTWYWVQLGDNTGGNPKASRTQACVRLKRMDRGSIAALGIGLKSTHSIPISGPLLQLFNFMQYYTIVSMLWKMISPVLTLDIQVFLHACCWYVANTAIVIFPARSEKARETIATISYCILCKRLFNNQGNVEIMNLEIILNLICQFVSLAGGRWQHLQIFFWRTCPCEPACGLHRSTKPIMFFT